MTAGTLVCAGHAHNHGSMSPTPTSSPTPPPVPHIRPSRRTVLAATAAAGAVTVGPSAAPAASAPAMPTAELVDTPARSAEAAPQGPRPPATAQAPSRELRTLLKEIDPDRIEATVRKLVSFGTRHTLSTQDDPDRGIGATATGSSRRCARTPPGPAAG